MTIRAVQYGGPNAVVLYTTEPPTVAVPLLVDWGDGSFEAANWLAAWAYHTYAAPGSYTVTITDQHGSLDRAVLVVPVVGEVDFEAGGLPGELPVGGPTTLELVKSWLEIDDDDDDPVITTVVGAVNSQVRGWRCAQDAVGLPAWPERVQHGTTMLASRIYRRKNSPAGVEAFTTDGAVYVSRNDPDIASFLGLGVHQPPTVG